MVKGQKYHILYKTTCKVTGDFYIGVHSTMNLEDEYLGSGKRLRYSIQKHGKENHVREILETFDSREELVKREREIVNEVFLKEEKCMNLAIGGEGGFVNRKAARAGGKASLKKLWKDENFRKKHIDLLSSIAKRNHKNGVLKGWPSWKGKFHTKETRDEIGKRTSISQKGEKNSQFGKCWIKKEFNSIKILKEDFKEWESNGWIKGRVM
jgi:hypothetical protein